jgi:hypothetical protein
MIRIMPGIRVPALILRKFASNRPAREHRAAAQVPAAKAHR